MRDLHHPVSIKTSPPALGGVIERERLIKALADLPAAAKWLQAPSGTGKSTLAASYARSRNKPLVWYRLDERDNDPAFFYDEFERALRAQGVAAPLPRFSGDDQDRQQQFAQRFVGALTPQFAERPVLIVMDDAQRVTSAEMQVALAALVSIAVNQSELLFVSESMVPGTFFDAIAARQLALLNDADLHFDAAECKAMTAALRVGAAESDSLATLTGGHAGALVLACELLRGTDLKSALGSTTVERIHSHLLSKLVERMPEPRRHLLLQTSFVAQLTRSIAMELAGPYAAHELDALVDSGLLRRVGHGTSEVFEAHGLVRQGMQTLVRAWRGAGETCALAERSAAVLVSSNQAEAAFRLLVENGSTKRAISVLEQLAEHYAVRGQADLMRTSIAKLSEAAVRDNAWLCFWAGQALLRVDEEHARTWLAHAYSAFERTDDVAGMRLAAASVVTVYGLECGDLRQLDTWIEVHTRADGDMPVARGDRFEASLMMGMMCAAFVRTRYPLPIDSEALVARMGVLIESSQPWLSDDQRVQAARLLIDHGNVFSNSAQAHNAIVATESLIDASLGGALHRGRWLISAASTHFVSGNVDRSLIYLNRARALVEQSGSAQLSFELGLAFAEHWMKAQDLSRAAAELSQLEVAAGEAAPAQRAQYARMTARLLLLQQHLPDGLRWAEEARRLAIPAGHSGTNLRMFDIELIYALVANDRLTDALDLLRKQEFDPREARVAIEKCLQFLLCGASDVQLLREGFTTAAKIGFVNLFDRARVPLAHLCAAALAHEIEREFVLRIIAIKQLVPPALAGPRWPWPVHLRTLGGFRLDIQGIRYSPPHKTQDKPLELLKLLVTCQALGRDSADKAWIAERLWPDADVANARKSLDMTLARLRKLLQREDAIVANEGRLQLAPQLVWTDITPLRHALSEVRARRDERVSGRATAAGAAAASIAAALEHYGGPYLADDEDHPWLLAGREAIATLVRQALIAADAVLAGTDDAMLITALEKALAADPTSEDLARALMRAHLRQGQNSEALRVYQRLREMLSLLLGIAPSAESDDIRSQAYAAQPGARVASAVSITTRPK